MRIWQVGIIALIVILVIQSALDIILFQKIKYFESETTIYTLIDAQKIYGLLEYGNSTEQLREAIKQGLAYDYADMIPERLRQRYLSFDAPIEGYVIFFYDKTGNTPTRIIYGTKDGVKETLRPDIKAIQATGVSADVRLIFALRSPFYLKTSDGMFEFSELSIEAIQWTTLEEAIQLQHYLDFVLEIGEPVVMKGLFAGSVSLDNRKNAPSVSLQLVISEIQNKKLFNAMFPIKSK